MLRNPFLMLLVMLLAVTALPLRAQQYGASISLQNIAIPQWNKALSTYGFSRPFLDDTHLRYTNNLHLSFYYSKNPYRNRRLAPSLAYSRKSLHAHAANLDVDLHFQHLELGALIRLRKVAHLKDINSFFVDLSPGLQLSRISLRNNGEPVFRSIDEATSQRMVSHGIGIGLSTKVGYSLFLTEELLLSPFAELYYVPLLYAPNSIDVLNQTAVNGLRDYSALYSFRLGFEISFCKKLVPIVRPTRPNATKKKPSK